jgi:hypothetical protein
LCTTLETFLQTQIMNEKKTNKEKELQQLRHYPNADAQDILGNTEVEMEAANRQSSPLNRNPSYNFQSEHQNLSNISPRQNVETNVPQNLI